MNSEDGLADYHALRVTFATRLAERPLKIPTVGVGKGNRTPDLQNHNLAL